MLVILKSCTPLITGYSIIPSYVMVVKAGLACKMVKEQRKELHCLHIIWRVHAITLLIMISIYFGVVTCPV